MRPTYFRIIKTIFSASLLLVPIHLLPQETGTCAENLKSAQTFFERGQVDQVPAILESCLKAGFNREEAISAYKLLIQSYLFEDKITEADSIMLEFLKKNPEYKLSPTDHSSFILLFNKFNVKPVLQFSVHLGTNLPFITFIDWETVSGNTGKNYYTSTFLNFYASAEVKFKLTQKLELNIETGYSQVKFTNLEEMEWGTTVYNESQQRIEIPFSATYDLKSFDRFTPYGRVGLGPAFTLSSLSTSESERIDENNTDPHSGKTINRGASRIDLDLFAQVGAGVKFKIRGGFLFGEIRSNFGFFNQTQRGIDLVAEKELEHFYFYKDDDFNINTLNFSLGYTQIFYKPTKRKE